VNVLFVSAEAVPFAKVGGMADVVGSLPAALRESGVDARIIMPGYGFIPHADRRISHLFSFTLPLRSGTASIHVYSTVYNGVPIYFLQSWPYFGSEDAVYTDWEWDVPRFIYFNQIVMGAIWELSERFGWVPDVCHVNDWHTGLLPFLISDASSKHPRWANMATMLSIHNMRYQGDNTGGYLFEAGIPGRDQPDLVYQDLTDNLLAIAMAYSDIITTVSPRYAIEIQYPYMGYGLDGMVRTRLNDVAGILNGIDTDLWNPATDRKLEENFDIGTVEDRRVANKRALQRTLGLPEREDILVVGLVSRLVWQKGLDILIPALRQFLGENEVYFVGLGTGSEEYERALWQIGNEYNWQARMFVGFDAAVAQNIYAGSDLFLMPSHFEPCGMGQMIAMRYGALPLVRETGGLADTVQNYDNSDARNGTGFVFQWQESDAIVGTLRWALETYHNRQEAWRRMQKRGMGTDFSWKASAKQYIELYQKAITKKRG
jgi:starch synthase